VTENSQQPNVFHQNVVQQNSRMCLNART